MAGAHTHPGFRVDRRVAIRRAAGPAPTRRSPPTSSAAGVCSDVLRVAACRASRPFIRLRASHRHTLSCRREALPRRADRRTRDVGDPVAVRARVPRGRDEAAGFRSADAPRTRVGAGRRLARLAESRAARRKLRTLDGAATSGGDGSRRRRTDSRRADRRAVSVARRTRAVDGGSRFHALDEPECVEQPIEFVPVGFPRRKQML